MTRASVSVCSILACRGVLDASSVWLLVIARSCSPACRFRIRGSPYQNAIASAAAVVPAPALPASPKMRMAVTKRSRPSASAKGRECQLGDDRHDAVELAAIGTAFDNAVIGTGRD